VGEYQKSGVMSSNTKEETFSFTDDF